MDNFNNTFGFDSSKQNAAMPSDYKPDINRIDICNNVDKAQYWQCIFEMQWALALGWINIMYATVAIYW